jgi:hypothetical protein
LYLYIKDLNSFIKNKTESATLQDLSNFSKSICNGLPSKEEIVDILKNTKNDKGICGKYIEYSFFGIRPNSDSTPDLNELGIDIKSTAFKTLKNGTKNAKERLTLTNCGNTKNYDSFKNINDNIHLSECQYYCKISRFILFIRNDDGIKYKTLDQLLNQPILSILYFDIEHLPEDIINAINTDYANIRECISKNKVSQVGQLYLHIHTHGAGHGSGNRAFGFTQRFITRIVALHISEIYKRNISEILIEKGKSIAINKGFL